MMSLLAFSMFSFVASNTGLNSGFFLLSLLNVRFDFQTYNKKKISSINILQLSLNVATINPSENSVQFYNSPNILFKYL